jgi:hypothetical protein
MARVSAAALLAATALPWEEVDVPELGGSVVVQGMSAAQRDEFESASMKGRGRKREFNQRNLRARLLVKCLVSEPGGAPLFSEAEAEQVGRIRSDVAQRLFNTAMKLCGLSDEDVEELGQPSETTGEP